MDESSRDRMCDVLLERMGWLTELGDHPRLAPADHAAGSVPGYKLLPLMNPDRQDQGDDHDEAENSRKVKPQPARSERGADSNPVIMI